MAFDPSQPSPSSSPEPDSPTSQPQGTPRGRRSKRLAGRRRRRHQPEPVEPSRETSWARFRRKVRRFFLRVHDWAIFGLYDLIAWLDSKAPQERRYFRVAIFGSSRTAPEDELYLQVQELARRLSYIGCDIVTGGGPGLMRAANEGARKGAYNYKTRSFGLSILLPMEEQPNPFLDEEEAHKTFFSRLHHFIRLSHAYIVVDGGIGTTLEAMMVYQLLQVRLIDENRSLIFVGPRWKGLRDWIQTDLIDPGFASPRDIDIPHWVDTVDEAVEIVRGERDRFLERHEVVLPPPVDDPKAPSVPEGEEPVARKR